MIIYKFIKLNEFNKSAEGSALRTKKTNASGSRFFSACEIHEGIPAAEWNAKTAKTDLAPGSGFKAEAGKKKIRISPAILPEGMRKARKSGADAHPFKDQSAENKGPAAEKPRSFPAGIRPVLAA